MSALMCVRCGRQIYPGTAVEMVGDALTEALRILTDDDVLIVHAECPTGPPATEALVRTFGAPDDLAEANTDVTNTRRAEWAAAALAVFRREVSSDDDVDTLVADLVCDALHLVTSLGGDPVGVLDNAWRHFRAEVGLGYES